MVDLAGVEFMDSSALGALVVMFTAVSQCGGRLCLAAPRQAVRSLLALTSVDRAMRVYDTVAQAEAGMRPAGG